MTLATCPAGCGWEGVPTYLHGRTQDTCPACGAGEAPGERADDLYHATAGVGRNEPCPCHSGRKFKKCHGR